MTDAITEHLRLAMLRIVNDAPGRTANHAVIQGALTSWGFKVSRDRVKTELAWLADQQAVTVGDIADYKVATANERTLEVAEGVLVIPGIQRPSPKA